MALEDLLEKILRLETNDNSLDVEMEPEEDSLTLPHHESIINWLLARLGLITSRQFEAWISTARLKVHQSHKEIYKKEKKNI